LSCIFAVFARQSEQTALLAWRIEKRNHVERSETGELGEKVLSEDKREARNLSLET